MPSPPISVVMPVNDGQAFLDEAVGSIRAQTFQDFELIIVDDGSRDATPEILRRHAVADRRIRIVTQPQTGVVAALNNGIAASGGPYLARMDADDVAKPDRLARQLEILARHPNVAAVGSGYDVIDHAGRVRRRVMMPTDPEVIRTTLERTNCMAHPTVLMRRDAVIAAGGYRGAFRHCEDYDLWLRLAEHHDLLNVEEPLLLYREHPGQLTWRNLEQRILSELGAHVSARHRRRGQPDPAERTALISVDVLRELGMTDADIRAQIVRRALNATREARRAGHWNAAFAAFALARQQGALPWRSTIHFLLALGGR